MNEEEFFDLERRFWLEGACILDDHLDAAVVMAFAGTGLLDATAVRETLADSPRWEAVAFADSLFTRPDERLAVLAYTAEAMREGAAPYRALCTSTWRRCGPGWRIVQHQQTPL